jgi:hypothetical protein
MVTCHWVRVVSDWGRPIWWTYFYSWAMSSSYETYARVGFFASLMGMWGNKRVKESCRKWKLLWLALWCSMSVWSRPETARSANGTWNKDLQACMLRWLLTAQMLSCCIVLTRGRRLLRVFLYLPSAQNMSSSREWSLVSQNRCKARAERVCEWSELMQGWQKRYWVLLDADLWRLNPVVSESVKTQSEALWYFWLGLS